MLRKVSDVMIRLKVCLLVGHLMSSVGKCTGLIVSFILKQYPQRGLLPPALGPLPQLCDMRNAVFLMTGAGEILLLWLHRPSRTQFSRSLSCG